MNVQLINEFNSKTTFDDKTGCWLYHGSRTVRGYGIYKGQLVHGLSYIQFVGESKNLVLHKQSCPNKNCWNWQHLYDGTYSENLMDSHQTNPRTKKTHCIRGHEMTPENTVSGKNCRQCNAIRKRKYKDEPKP